MHVRHAIVLALLQDGGYLSGEQLSETLGMTRAAIWKHIQALRSEGYVIQSAQNKGYFMESCPDVLNSALVFRALKTRALGRNPVCFPSVESTNLYAKKLAQQNAVHGTLVIAQEQTKGRGRMGRSWLSSPSGGIYMSLVLRPRIAPEEAPKLTLIAALAVWRAVNLICGLNPKIKWPNDLLFGGKKFCGILTEMSANMDELEYAVVGIGINVNTERFEDSITDTATSLFLKSGTKYDRNALAAQVLNHLEQLIDEWLTGGGFAPLLDEYRDHCESFGQRVHIKGVTTELLGTVEDFDELGMILLRKDDGTLVRVASGDVSLRKIEVQ